MIEFIYERFRAYRKQKSSVGIWPVDGRLLRDLAEAHHEVSLFEQEVRQSFNLAWQTALPVRDFGYAR